MNARRLLPGTDPRLARTAWKLGIGSWVLILSLTGCGKKGPPLAPLIRVPGLVSQIAARRVGDDVVLNLTLPVQNVDQSIPVNLGRVEVFGYTGRTAPPSTRFVEVARLVASIDVLGGANASTVRDTLAPDELVEGPPLPRLAAPSARVAPAPPDDPRAPLRRYYMAVAFSESGRAGPPSAVVEVALTPLPDSPDEVRVSYDADAVTVRWTPSGGLVGFLFDNARPLPASPLDDGPPASDAGALPAGPTRYNVYRDVATQPDAPEVAEKTRAAPPPVPLNPMPLESFTFTDPLRSDGQRHCYAVSAVRGQNQRQVEGHPSMAICVTTIDIFPPARPIGLSPIAAEGTISLVWEANTDRDLQGYQVWRGEDGSETLTRITEDVVKETRYTDEGVKPGVRYVYAVTAVDNQSPKPNVSPESERVEVTAR
jgi:hypothetical protein